MKKILEDEEYGKHIELYCENHPEKRFSTKNIAPIGTRTIFYKGEKEHIDLLSKKEMGMWAEVRMLRDVKEMSEDCGCDYENLRPVPQGKRVFL